MINNEDRGEQSDGIFKALVDGLPDIVVRYDRQARHLFISNNINQFDDLQPAQFIGKTHRELGFPEDTCQYMEDSVRSVFETGLPVETEYNIEYKQGLVTHNLRLMPELDAQGNVRSVLSITRDITAHRQAEKLYQSLFLQMETGFSLHEIICDEQGVPVNYRYITVNSAFERMTGLSSKDVVGRTVKDVVPGIEPYLIEVYGKVALSGEPVSFEHFSAPLLRHFKVAAFQPAPYQFACLFTDITEHKQVDDIQTFLAQTSSGSSDEPFFNTLARYLAKSLDMDFVCIDRLEGDGLNARTVAVWCDGQFEDNVTYALKDTPCGEVVGKTVCCFPASVCAFFPRDQVLEDLKAESYVGVTLWSHTGEPIGLIAVIGRRPLLNRPLAEETLRLVSVRAAGELERQDAEAKMQGTNDYLNNLLEYANAPIIVWDPQLRITRFNHAFELITGRSVVDVLGKPVQILFPTALVNHSMELIRKTLIGDRWESVEIEIQHRDGSIRTVLWNSATLYKPDGITPIATIAQGHEITIRRQAEAALVKSEAKFRSFVENVSDIIFSVDLSGIFTYVSPNWQHQLGHDVSEVIGRSFNLFVHPDDMQKCRDIWELMLTTDGSIRNMEYRVKHQDGSWRWHSYDGNILRDDNDNNTCLVGVARDITEYKLKQKYREMSHEIIKLLNQTGDTYEAIQQLVTLVRARTEFDAVAIRMQDGDDFPYFYQEGFSDDFIELENSLIERGPDGGVCCDDKGNVSLACTCGLVISGKTDPANPLCTRRGSFWVNDPHPLIELTAEQDPRHLARNRCFQQGYASVALVPIRNNEKIVGLLQLNDRREDCFTLDTVEMIEGLAEHIGSALSRKQTESVLQASEERYRSLFNHAPLGYQSLDEDGCFIELNQAWLDTLGYQRDEVIGKWFGDFLAPEYVEAFRGRFPQFKAAGKIHSEFQMMHKDGRRRFIAFEGRIGYQPDGVTFQKTHCILSDITERKRTEEALKESESRFRSYFTLPLHGVAITSPHKGWVEVNDRLCTILGYSRAELLLMTWEEMTHSDDLAADVEQFEKIISGQIDSYRLDKRFIRKDGAVVWTAISVGCVRNSNGNVDFIVCVMDDITERKRAEQELHDSEDRFRLAIVNAPIPIILHAEDGEVLQISQAWTEISGYTHEDIPTIDDWTERAYGIHKQSVRADIDALYSLHGRKDEGEYVVTSADGRKLTWVFSSAGLGQLSDGRRIAVSMAMDITERKRTERALAEKDYFLIASQRVAKIGSYKLDFATGIWESSEVLDMIFGIDTQYPRSVMGWLDIVFPEDREMMDSYLRDTVIDQRQPFNTEYRIQRISDGAVEWVHGMGDVEFDLTGHPVSMFGTIQDITARKLAELEQTKLEDQLWQAMKMDSVGRLAGGVAHDFNNMLGVILGHAQMGMELVEPTQQLHDDLHEILTAAERSANLTRQLLTFARKQTIVPKVLNMNEAITGLLRMLERLIGENIKLNWRPSADLWLVKLDPTQVDQILANLCVNARDAITDVGQITIETDNIVIDDAFCTDHIEFKPGEYVQLSVSDSGCGMDKDTLSQIFEPFFTTKGLGEGTGLGLSTVFGAVKQNDGFINAYSEPGHGSRFTIYLPRHVDSDVQVSVNPVTAPAAHGYETILLVEDEPSILKMTKMMLERLGYTVITAAAPAEAIRLAEVYQGEIDMLLTDVVMPEMNGKDLAAKLLSLYPQLKRLFMSGYTADVIAQRDGLGNGVHFIQKPFSMRDLSAIVRKAMAGD